MHRGVEGRPRAAGQCVCVETCRHPRRVGLPQGSLILICRGFYTLVFRIASVTFAYPIPSGEETGDSLQVL